MSSQTAFSSPSTPLNVEFSAPSGKVVIKEPQKASNPTLPEKPQTQKQAQNVAGEAPEQKVQPNQDPVSISKSLRKVRASGSLIIEASKKKHEEMNQIISQAIEGFENKRDEPDQPPQPPPQRIARSPRKENAQQAVQHKTQMGMSAAGVMPPVARRAAASAAGTVPRPNPASLPKAAQLPPNGPSTVLAQASGFKPHSSIGLSVAIGLIVLTVLLGIGTYFAFRDRLLAPPRVTEVERDLKRVEDQSAQYILLGERDRDQGNYNAAVEYFQHALLLTPNSPNVHFLMAQTYLNAGKTDEALKSYKALLQLVPDHLEARLRIAEIYQARGNWNSAYQEYQRIIALNQNSPQAAVALEAIEAHGANQPKPSIIASKAVRPRTVTPKITMLPKGPVAPPQLSLFTPRLITNPLIKPPDALIMEKPFENPDPRALAETRKNLGLRYLYVKEYRAAINEFLTSLRLTPDDRDIYYFLGSAYHGLGQLELAHDYYKRVDKGQYIKVAQSGAKKTEKAAREASKRRTEMLKNEQKKEANGRNTSGNVILNSLR